jgi:hypothetical protein
MTATADADPERYKGRPLLIILENYILDSANHTMLHPVQFAKMVADQNFAHLIDPTDPAERAAE